MVKPNIFIPIAGLFGAFLIGLGLGAQKDEHPKPMPVVSTTSLVTNSHAILNIGFGKPTESLHCVLSWVYPLPDGVTTGPPTSVADCWWEPRSDR